MPGGKPAKKASSPRQRRAAGAALQGKGPLKDMSQSDLERMVHTKDSEMPKKKKG